MDSDSRNSRNGRLRGNQSTGVNVPNARPIEQAVSTATATEADKFSLWVDYCREQPQRVNTRSRSR